MNPFELSSRNFELFGSFAEIGIYEAERTMADIVLDDVYREALRLQKIFNVYDQSSEISMLNKKKGMVVSDELREVIKEALLWCHRTNGVYDITHGLNFMRKKSGMPLKQLSCSYKDVKMHGRSISLNHPEAILDLGSIAKGYIVDKLVSFMQASGIESGFIDARGDMAIFGGHLELIDIQHPRLDAAIQTIIFEQASVATSGDYRQYYGSYEQSHLVYGHDDFSSVTVVAPTTMLADVLATCIFLLDKQCLREISSIRPEAKIVAIEKDLSQHWLNGAENLVYKNEH